MLNKILSSLSGQALNIIDEVVTSKEEKLKLKNEIKKTILNHEVEIQKNVTERWKADSSSDSWLSKNVRPMVLIFLVISTVLMIFIEAGVIAFQVKASWIDLLELVLITVIGAYFGGRTMEKRKKS